VSTSKTFQPLTTLLCNENSGLSRLLQRARQLQQLTDALAAILPQPVHGHCRVGNVSGDTLVLVTDSPAWSTRLRFHTPAILEHLKETHGLALHGVRIRVHPPELPRQIKRVARNPTLGSESAALLRQTAQGISDPDLKQALLRLARHGSHGH